MGNFARALHHLDMKDVKKKRLEEIAAQKLKEKKDREEKKIIQETSKKYTLSCPKTGEKNTMEGNPVGSYDGTKDFVIKDMIKDIKTLMAEYHEDATVVRNEN